MIVMLFLPNPKPETSTDSIHGNSRDSSAVQQKINLHFLILEKNGEAPKYFSLLQHGTLAKLTPYLQHLWL